ncbi:MAG: FHA domain-containing protein, partial [Deltaproteobacteria bacterium]|nr:FHA domain-containing protein [Deltaproteobacteria bacterium]
MVPLTFKIYQGGQLVRTETLTRDVIKVGKLLSAHLRLTDESVSRMHAYIQVQSPDEVYISDLGSARGTIVNGQKVNKCRLQNGDEILLGDTKLIVEIGAAPAVQAPGPVAAQPGVMPGMQPGAMAGMQPGAMPGMQPGAMPGMQPGAMPGMQPGAMPGMQPGMMPAGMGGYGDSAMEPEFETVELTPSEVDAVEKEGSAVQVKAWYLDEERKVVHLSNPKAGKPSGATLGMTVIGALLVALGVGLFSVEVWHIGQQKKHQAKVGAFLKSRGLPQRFVPEVHGSPAMEMGAIGGLLGGLALFLWGYARWIEDKKSPHFTVGPDPKATFHVSEEMIPSGVGAYPLVRSDGTAYQVLFKEGTKGKLEHEDGSAETLEELVSSGQAQSAGDVAGYAFAVPSNGKVTLELGPNRFEISNVKPGRTIAARPQREWRTWGYYSGSFVAHAVLLFFMLAMPEGAGSMESDSMQASSRFGRIARNGVRDQQKEIEAKQKEEKKKIVKETKDKIKTDQKGSGPVDERLKSKGSGGPPSPIKTSARVSMARGAGMLGVLGRMNGKALASVFGRESAVSSDAENALGSLVGNTMGDAYGLGGLVGGGGRGGGGSGAGGIGLGGW